MVKSAKKMREIAENAQSQNKEDLIFNKMMKKIFKKIKKEAEKGAFYLDLKMSVIGDGDSRRMVSYLRKNGYTVFEHEDFSENRPRYTIGW